MALINKLGLVALLSALPLIGYAQDATPTDPQIAAIVVAANQVDIDAGKLAKSKTHSKAVKDFAQLMITDHTSVNQSAAKLKTLKCAAFDKAYAEHEVAYHQQVLDAIDKTLIPSAKNEELKALLVKVRPTIAEHLDHARELQSKLGGDRGKSSD